MRIEIGGTYRHVRRGTTYEVVGRARMQIGPSTAAPPICEALEKMTFVVYRATEDDTLWCRPESEFCDGRFIEEN